ncbi:MAG: M20/M25/M40 family metallo-hydrolase [Bacteroidia bacterium]|nr:M20/M25/M40 family metallo-hydrolase [Bacteroidia bacterium]
MKIKQSILFILCLTGLTLFMITCSKDEESEQQRKEAITIKLNNDINADTLKTFVTWMQGMGTRFALSDNHKAVAQSIKNRFKMVGYTDARIDSFMINKTYQNINYQQWQYNVIATLEGKSNPDSVCIIGAHYDNNLKTGDPFSIVPGANDNASGVAAALEIARVMKKNNYSPRNTIEFIAFGSEELGLYGSYAYANDAKQNSKKIKLMLNNDMIAYQPGTNQSEWIVNINDYDNSHNLRTEAEQMCSRFTVLKYINDNTYNRQSDSYPFFTNGFEALFFFSDYIDPNYHTLNDLVEYCNFDYCREIVKGCCALLVDNN